MGFKFEKLQVWQKAIDLTQEIDKLTKEFPKEETYVLSTQIKRVTDSIALNIAEGSTDQSNPEFSKFLGYAVKSGVEVISCLHIGKKRGIIQDADFQKLYRETESIIVMTQSLRKSLK